MTNEEFQLYIDKIQQEQNLNNLTSAEELCHDLITAVEILLASSNYENRNEVVVMYARTLRQKSELLLQKGVPKEALAVAHKAIDYALESGNKTLQAVASNNLGRVYVELSEYQVALELHSKALELFIEINDSVGKAHSFGNLGIVYQNLGEYQLSLQNNYNALTIFNELGNISEVARMTANIGLVYQNISEFEKSLESYWKALAIFEQLENKLTISIITGNIGLVYFLLNDFAHALEYMGKSLAIKEELGMKSSAALVMGNIGNIYKELYDFPLALEYLFKALSIHEELGKKSEAAVWIGSIGVIYMNTGDYSRALEYFLKAQATHEQHGRKAEIAIGISNIGRIYSEKNFEGYNVAKAEEYFLKAIAINEEIGAKHNIFKVCKFLAELYESEKRWEESVMYYKKYYDLEKDVVSEESKKQADKFAYERQIAEQEKKIAIEQARNEEIMRQQHILEEQAAKIQLKNTELHEINIKLDSAYNLLSEQAANIQLKNTELHESNIELNDANRKLEEAGKFKMKILGIASHDLKNPITGINMSAEMLIKYAALPPETVRTLQMITGSSKRMLDIVVNLMDVAARQLGEIKLEYSNTDIAELTKDVCNDYLHRAAEKKQTIDFFSEGNCNSIVDSERMRQVLDNIISNAVKYSEKGKAIKVSVIASQDNVTIRVADKGQGLSEEDMLLLFKDFQKLSARPTGGESSSGLGLSVVKHLVELHGGRVWAASEGKGKGSTFFVELPR